MDNSENDDCFDESFHDHEAIEHSGMTEEEAFDIYDLAFALGFGEEISLQEAEAESAALAEDLIDDSVENEQPMSLRARKKGKDSEIYSSVTGRRKCPFEQWVKDVATGRKSVHDPVGGSNSYGHKS